MTPGRTCACTAGAPGRTSPCPGRQNWLPAWALPQCLWSSLSFVLRRVAPPRQLKASCFHRYCARAVFASAYGMRQRYAACLFRSLLTRPGMC